MCENSNADGRSRGGLQWRIRHGNGKDIGIEAESLLFATIVMSRGTVDIAVDIDLYWSMLGIIQCNGAVKWFP